MDWLKRNYKTVIGTLVILILLEATVSWYLLRRFREDYLSADEAVAVALADAGLDAGAVGAPSVALKTEDGRAWYEVDFAPLDAPEAARHYQIDAETGGILTDAPN